MMQNTQNRSVQIGLFVACLVSLLASSSQALPISLGTAADYAVLGIGGTVTVESDLAVYQSATVINGNVGAGPYTAWGHGIDATINGRVNYDTTDSAPTVTGTISGGVHQQPMSGVVADALSASAAYAALAPTLTFSTL